MRINEVDKTVTQADIDQLEVFADRLFAKVGIDVEFTRHFLDRVNDERNVRQITVSELTRLFKQEYKRWGKQIAQLGPDVEAVLKDLATDVNIPFALRWDEKNKELDLIVKTVMRKKNFRTPDQEFAVEGKWDLVPGGNQLKDYIERKLRELLKKRKKDNDSDNTNNDRTDGSDGTGTGAGTGAGAGAAGRKNKKDKKDNRRRNNIDIDSNPATQTDMYGWLAKYGPNALRKNVGESILQEGGAMPGVGAIHIEEINPTLEQLEKALDLDLKDFVLGSVGKREFSGDIDVALNLQAEEIPAFVEKLKKSPLIFDIAKSSVIMTKVKIVNYDESKSDGRPRTGYVQLDFMPGDPGWLKTYYHSPSDKESKYKGVFRNIMVATMAAVHNRQDSAEQTEDGRPLESVRYMWSPTDGLVKIRRTPVRKKTGDGYTKKNNNEIIEGPWKQADEIAKQLGIDSGQQLNSFESLLDAIKKNYTKEALQQVIKGFAQNPQVQDIGVPEELKNEN